MTEKIFPYSIPKNWQWTTLENVCECLDNFRSPVNTTERTKRFGNIPYYGATGQVGWINDFLTDEQLVLLGEDGAPFLDSFKSKAYIIEGKAWVNNHAHILRSNFGEIGNKFLKYYLNVFDFTDYVSGTTRLKLTQSKMKKIPIPLPPLDEQKKIVERIESLFSKLDAAKEKVQAVLDGYELRRSAILHQAFTGELSKNFRAENNLSLDDWQEKTLGKVSDVRDGTHDSPEFYESGFPLITSKNLKNGLITADGIKHICQADYEKINLRSKVDVGDILFAMIGTIGNPVVISEEPNFAIKNVALFKDLKKMNMKFLKYFLESYSITKKMKSDAKGTTQKFLPLNYLRNFPVIFPSLAEQKEIVRVLDSLLDKEQRTKEIAEKTLHDIDLMKKSILARAFRGKL